MIEFTPDIFIDFEKSRSENMLLTIFWQSSKFPSIAILKTFLSSTVVINFLWIGEILLFGCKTNIFKLFLPLIASIAAAPVSPDVATTILIFSSFLDK